MKKVKLNELALFIPKGMSTQRVCLGILLPASAKAVLLN
jgi:hypothetical protein